MIEAHKALCQDMSLWEQAGTEYSSPTPYTEIPKIFPDIKNGFDEQKHTKFEYNEKCILKECILMTIHGTHTTYICTDI